MSVPTSVNQVDSDSAAWLPRIRHGGHRILLSCLLALAALTVQAQTGEHAFVTCVKHDGNLNLCAMELIGTLEGYSSAMEGWAARLGPNPFTEEAAFAACAIAPTPTSLEIDIIEPNLHSEDRIYFNDIIVDAYDEAGNFLMDVPVKIRLLTEEGVLSFESSLGYIEAMGLGNAALEASPYCGNIKGSHDLLSLTVTPGLQVRWER